MRRKAMATPLLTSMAASPAFWYSPRSVLGIDGRQALSPSATVRPERPPRPKGCRLTCSNAMTAVTGGVSASA